MAGLEIHEAVAKMSHEEADPKISYIIRMHCERGCYGLDLPFFTSQETNKKTSKIAILKRIDGRLGATQKATTEKMDARRDMLSPLFRRETASPPLHVLSSTEPGS